MGVVVRLKINLLASLLLLLLLPSCVTNPPRIDTVIDVPASQSSKLTLGKVQQTLKKGMMKDEVIANLGSPNMVTRDRNGLETWIYDKLSTERSRSNNSDSLGGVIGASSGSFGVGIGMGTSNSVSQEIQSQKTLTVIIKFKDNLLEEFSYSASSF